jgi:hypothetical protein
VDNEPENDFAFKIERPDDDGFEWICSDKGREVWCRNLGRADDAAEAMCQWLVSIDYSECS